MGPASSYGVQTYSPFRYCKNSREIFRLAVILYVRFPLLLRDMEDLQRERGIDISEKKIRCWRNRFRRMVAQRSGNAGSKACGQANASSPDREEAPVYCLHDANR